HTSAHTGAHASAHASAYASAYASAHASAHTGAYASANTSASASTAGASASTTRASASTTRASATACRHHSAIDTDRPCRGFTHFNLGDPLLDRLHRQCRSDRLPGVSRRHSGCFSQRHVRRDDRAYGRYVVLLHRLGARRGGQR